MPKSRQPIRPQQIQYLLDTNILLAYVRWKELAQYIEETYRLGKAIPTPIISVVSEAEIRVLAEQNGWGPSQRQKMQENLLDYLTIVPIPYKDIVPAYVEIDHYSRGAGRKMGKNDLWIAATARVEKATILTTDKDFDHLPQDMVKHIYIDPASHL